MNAPASAGAAPERLRRMLGRDPHEPHRVATPLELLYDLTFAVAFGQAGSAFAHEIATGDLLPAVGAYLVACFAIFWAWSNYSWYASAFDTDDWAHRLLTLVQMVGVVVLSLGIPEFFHSLHDEYPHNQLMVAGYIVMRVAMVLQWWRVWRAGGSFTGPAKASMLWTAVIQAA